MGLKLPDNIVYGGHMNIKVAGDGFVASRLSMLGYNLVYLTTSDNSLVFFVFSMLIAVHTVTQSSRMTSFRYSNW